jgi:hypothetical protein
VPLPRDVREQLKCETSTVWLEWVRLTPEPRRFRDPLTLGAEWRRGPLAGSLSEQEDELGDYERLSETGQAMIHAVMRAA